MPKPDATKLAAGLTKIRESPTLSAQFAQNPATALRAVGIDPKSVSIGPMAAVGKKLPLGLAEIRKVNPKTGKAGTALTVCGSVGGGAGITVCGSVG